MSRFPHNMAACLLALFLAIRPVSAHEVRPVYLDIRETTHDHFEVTWRVPVTNGMAPPVSPKFSRDCTVSEGPQRVTGGSAERRYTLICPKGLAGTDIALAGLSRTMVDGLVRVEFASGQTVTQLVHPARPSFRIPPSSSTRELLRSYGLLGLEHILTGWDHLLFVLGLVLLIRRPRAVFWSLTVFTLAHCVTLSLAALGVIHFPPALVEALIALSILVLALELAAPAKEARPAGGWAPVMLALGFGLLHGLGFAGALARIGLPANDIPTALFGFNVGVELGQIAFVTVLLSLGLLAKGARPAVRIGAYRVCVFCLGSVSAFWTIERVLAF